MTKRIHIGKIIKAKAKEKKYPLRIWLNWFRTVGAILTIFWNEKVLIFSCWQDFQRL